MKKSLSLIGIGLMALSVWPGKVSGAETWKEVRLDGEIVLIRPAPAGPAAAGRVFAAEGRTTLIRVAPDLGEAGRAAAADIERYLPLACGGRALGAGDADAAHNFGLVLATQQSGDFISRAGIKKELPAVGEQECLILPVEAFSDGRPGVALVGGSARGLLNGVYTLLEISAGVFWETGRILERREKPPSTGAETTLVHSRELSWPQGQIVWKPAVSDRVLYIGFAPDMVPAVNWASRNRISHLVISTPREFPLSGAQEKSLRDAVDQAHGLGIRALFLNMTHRLPVNLGALKPSSPEAIQASTDMFAGLVSKFGLDGFAWHSASEGIDIAADPEYQKQKRAYWEARYFNSYYSAIRKIKKDALMVMLLGWVYMNPAEEMKRLFPKDIVAWVVPNTPIIDAALSDIPSYDENFDRIWYWQYVTVSRDGAFPMVKLDYLEKYFAEALERGHGLAPQGVFGVNAFNAMYFAQVARDGRIPHEAFLRSFAERFYGDARMGEALLDFQTALVYHRNWYNNVHTRDVENYLNMEESSLLKGAFETTAGTAVAAKSPLLKDRLKTMAVTMLRCFLRRSPHLRPQEDPAKSWTMDYMSVFGWNRRAVEDMVRQYEDVFGPTEPAAAGDLFGEEFLKIRSALLAPAAGK
ncbi:MAG: hypothetical protein A2W03_08150 [Candidatus Aminicenantes bacterium RBG_16_63_16]|nr:MAG: hypothetical protein A2W03_08150 [Candidatus Aminicenantes bacterium RBG_16_63_16]